MKTSALTLATLLSLSLGACTGAEKGDSSGPKKGAEAAAGQDAKRAPTVIATRVEVARIEVTSAQLHLVRPGEVESAHDVNLAAPMGGLIEKMSLEVGDTVSKGDTLAKVDSSLMSAQSQLARVEVKDAEREFERLKSMGKAVAQVRVDAAETRLARAKAQSRISSIQSSRTYVKAPFDSTVADVVMEKGEVAPPGGVLLRLVVMDPAVVTVAVADRDVGRLSVGGEATVTTGGMARSVEGKILRIDPTADLKTRSFKVEVEVANPDMALKPGMIATVDFRQPTQSDQVIIPQHFLVTKLASNGVYVVDDQDTAQWRELELGAVVRDQVIVEGGLEVGERVVSVGQRGLVEGDKLIVAREGVCCVDGRVRFGASGIASAQLPETALPAAKLAEDEGVEGKPEPAAQDVAKETTRR